MCGGIGSRFWPYSRSSRPKQFIDFLGTGRTLLQMSFDRILPLVPKENVLIVTNEQYAPLVREQLPELAESQILLEPARRNTAPCIAWAAYHIAAIDPEASIIVAPSDHLITRENIFVDSVERGFRFVETHDALLTLGIRPSRPETGYGYIQVGQPVDGVDGICKVKTFTEKPKLELAPVFSYGRQKTSSANSGCTPPTWPQHSRKESMRSALPPSEVSSSRISPVASASRLISP